MTRRSQHRCPSLLHSPALLPVFLMFLIAGLTGALGLVTAATDPSPSSAGTTIEPLPRPAVALELQSMQKQARGGIASLRLRVDAGKGGGSFVITSTAPAGTVFADGSTSKTWSVEGGRRVIPFDLIASEDGSYVVAVEMTGTVHGKPVRRAAAHKVLVGVDERLPEVRSGAIEFAAATSEGGGR